MERRIEKVFIFLVLNEQLEIPLFNWSQTKIQDKHVAEKLSTSATQLVTLPTKNRSDRKSVNPVEKQLMQASCKIKLEKLARQPPFG
jgi:hypothetical protein